MTVRSRKRGPVTGPDRKQSADVQADRLAEGLLHAACEGARALLPLWREVIKVERKDDGSVVSEADHAADEAVRKELAALDLGWPLVSEERAGVRVDLPDRFLLLDPLDGTAEFLDHGAEFCVCLAAVENGRAIAGAIVAPVLKRGWVADASAWAISYNDDLVEIGRDPIGHAGKGRAGALTGLVSRRHGDTRSDAGLRHCSVTNRITVSSAIKYGFLAEGAADIHIRFGRTMMWDIAAGDAILNASGGAIRDFNGAALSYAAGPGSFDNPPFVAVSHRSLLTDVLAAVQRTS